jgi:hypothetical protein
MAVILLDHKNQKLGVCPERIVEMFERRPRSDEAIAELDRLHRERIRLLCECERVLHVVQREFPFLRRNPGQNAGGVECGLCEASRHYESQSAAVTAARRERSGVSFILATRIHPEGSDGGREEGDRLRRSGSGGGPKYARAFGVFFSLMEGAGFTSLASSSSWNEAWGRLHDQLMGIHLHPESRKTLADVCWMPGGFYKGGLKGMNNRMLDEWDNPDIQPEGWLFAIIDEPPESNSVSVSAITGAMRQKNEAQGKEVYPPYVLTVPKHNVAVIGRSGPYLALAAASVNDKESSPYRKPIIRRLLLQAIAGEHHPVPVESSYERETVLLLQRLGIPFKKPIFDDSEGLRPDFVLPNHRLIIEVQGLNTDDYREKKKLIHQRLMDSPAYHGFNLITYDANDGQPLSDFEKRLRSSIINAKSEKRAPRVKNP